ncbi:hypothetical protein [Lysobacter gummosus]
MLLRSDRRTAKAIPRRLSIGRKQTSASASPFFKGGELTCSSARATQRC